jgi:CAAX protease family protein
MALLRRHSLLIGLLLMYALTWSVYLSNAGVLPFRLPFPLYLLASSGFSVAAIGMTWLTLGGRAVIDLLKRFILWRIGWRWYASLLIIPLTYLFGASLHALVNGIPLDFRNTVAYSTVGSTSLMWSALLPLFIGGVFANGEEIGWRGYALPRLQGRYAALFSAIVLGAIWGLWHIAVYIRSFNPTWFAWYMVGVIAKSVLITWAYNGSRGSLLLASLYHSMWNTAGVFLPITTKLGPADPGAFAYVVLSELAVAAFIAWRAGPEHLSRTRARQTAS